MEEDIKQLRARVERLEEENQKLRSSHTIPFDVGKAFEARLSGLSLVVSSKGANTEDQAVNEGGMGTYDVLGDPDGFLEIIIGGTTYYVPYY